MSSARTDTIGTGTASAVSGVGDSTAMATGDVIINGVTIGGSSAADDNASSTKAASSAIAKAAAINRYSAQTGVSASVNANVAAGVSMTAAAATGTITINGVATGSISTTTDTSVTRQSVVAGINAISDRTGVTAVDTGDDKSGVKLTAADGRNIDIAFGTITSAATGVAAAGTTYGSYSLTSDKSITVTEGTGTISNTGLRAGTYAAQKAYVTAKSAGTTTALVSGDVKINGVLIGASLTSYDTASSTLNSASAISKAAAINKVSAQTGVTASAKNELSGSSMTAASLTGTITINGVATDSFTTVSDTAKDRAATVAAINKISGRTGVVAVDGGSDTIGVKLTAADGRNIDLSFATLTAAATGVKAAGTYIGRVALTSAGKIDVDVGTTGTGTVNLGIDAGVYGSGKSGAAIASVDLTTVAGANAALTSIDNALAQVNAARGDLGAVQNRFNATVSNLQTTAENLTASRSRIQDADFASETANLTRAQILQQAGVAMLAQANSLPQQVLSLLK
jgi:flagellin